ncbi:monovalent cation:proton antiporter-2 (CPA2) family protein [uncultured Shewanella sp.]|uniref:monovalent cation:proton antiporter-2 (CPA2) family protein n=1 Tax=uncultured Shewanella sp. TaxID=173975 RepID=UPI0026072986|nr:monovalent cation:proton antiporter-2 (CPA2) family protein [uncultured Shewanella sp.]
MFELSVVYLAAAIIAVPIAKRLGLGSVLGYLLAGILIGPFFLSLVGDQTEVMHFAEFGVVMMLFLVGLELQPSRLWKLRRSIIGLGGLQLGLTTLVIFVVCFYIFLLSWQASLALGLMLALSSTAIVLQTLTEKGWIKQEAGQNSFSVLLFQDIAVIPILALLPLLALGDSNVINNTESLIDGFPLIFQVIFSVMVIASIVFFGKFIAGPVFRYIAETRLREIFTVFALFLVIAIALLMQKIGLSPALGTFLAGVVLAESEFRHELEADIEPFKGLLLGLFFITVGASIDFSLLLEYFLLVFTCVIALIIVKATVLFVLGNIFKLQGNQKLLFTLALAQGGEFAFVLLSLTGSLSILSSMQVHLTTLVVAISMLLAPILLLGYEFFEKRKQLVTDEFDSPDEIEATGNVIIAGYGRFGQVVGRLLKAQGYQLSILDHSPSQIEMVRRFGSKVYYGDAARFDLLAASGAAEAKLLVIAIDDPVKTLVIIELCQKYFPNLKLVARAIDRRHAYELMRLGIKCFRRETFDSATSLGIDALKLLGHSDTASQRAGELFRQHDEASLESLSHLWGDDQSYGVAIKQRLEDLAQVLEEDKKQQDKLNACKGEDCV